MLRELFIKKIQHISGFIIGNYSLFVYLYSLKNQTIYISLLKSLDIFVLKHSVLDLMIHKKYDTIIHRFCMSCFCFYCLYTSADIFIFLSTILNTEIANIFYVLKCYLKEDTILYDINYALFYVTFFKFKIYDFYFIIHNHNEFYLIENDYKIIVIICIYTLYIINLYWFVIMNKYVYDKIKIVRGALINHKVCGYIKLINIPLTIFMYSYNPTKRYIYDLLGITLLSITTYQNHNDIYNKLINKKIDERSFTDKEELNDLLFETICIHLRSYLSILTNYYNVENVFFILFVSGIFHLYSIFLSNMNVINLFIHQDDNQVFLDCHKIILAVPIACDCFLIFMNSPNEIAIPYFLINIISTLLSIVKPFEQLTDIAFQTLLIGQTYYSCLSNINNIYH